MMKIPRISSAALFEFAEALAWGMMAAALVLALAGCTGDGASPFDKPDESAQPVSCASSASCG